MKNSETKLFLVLTVLLMCLIWSALAMSVPRPILEGYDGHYTYTGASQSVRDTNGAEYRSHYTLSGTTSATDAGTYTVTATLRNPFTGEGNGTDYWNDGGGERHYAPENHTWTIPPLNLWDKSIILSGSSFVYDAKPKTPFLQIAGYPHLQPKDIEVAYSKGGVASDTPLSVGTWTVSVVGRSSNLTDHPAPNATFTITQLDLSGKGISLQPGPYVFHKGEWQPFASVTDYPDLKASDYSVSYTNNVNAGTASVTVTGKAPNCKGSTTVTFSIAPAPLPSRLVLAFSSVVYDGTSKRPAASIAGLVEGRDFVTAYATDTINAGEKTVIATGMGNYSADTQLFSKYTVARRPLAASYVNIASMSDMVYTGSQIAPRPAVTFSGVTLSHDTDFRYSYGANIDAGDANTLTITCREPGNYSGSQTASFRIIPQPVPVPVALQVLTYSGLLQDAPVPHDVRYKLTGALNATDAGTHELSASLISGNYRWEDNGAAQRSLAWQIDTLSLERLTIDSITAQLYTGSQIVPEVVARLDGRVMVPQTGFLALYGANTSAGASAGIVTLQPAGLANYTPGTSQTAAFDITPKHLADAEVQMDEVEDPTYTGLRITPTPQIAYLGNILSEGTDFVYSYGENTHAGDAHTLTVTAIGGGNYQGSRTIVFSIKPKALADQQVIIASVAPGVYTGLQQRPMPGVAYLENTLKEGADFSFSYGDNIDVGSAHTLTITAAANGNYHGQKTLTFTILQRSISDDAVSVVPPAQAFAYSAEEHRPKPEIFFDNGISKVALVEDIDFSYTYSANTHGAMSLSPVSGKPAVIFTGKGNFMGSRHVNFVIIDTLPPEIIILEDRGGEVKFLVKDNWGLQRVSAHRSGRVLIDETFSAVPATNSREYTISHRLPGVYSLRVTDLYGYEAVYGPISFRDNDGDGLSDSYERMIGTRRFEPDTDGDGLRDGDEVLRFHTDPRKVDGDNDGIPDAVEINTVYNPRLYSTRGSGLNDGAMLLLSTFAAKSAVSDRGLPCRRVLDTLVNEGALRALPYEAEAALRVKGERIMHPDASKKDYRRVDALKLQPVWADASSGIVLGIQDGLLLTFTSHGAGTYRLSGAMALLGSDPSAQGTDTVPVIRVDGSKSILLIGFRAQATATCATPLILYDVGAGQAYAVTGSEGAEDFGFTANGTGISYQLAEQVYTLECMTP